MVLPGAIQETKSDLNQLVTDSKLLWTDVDTITQNMADMGETNKEFRQKIISLEAKINNEKQYL